VLGASRLGVCERQPGDAVESLQGACVKGADSPDTYETDV
jgi:hypothetical protein